MAEKKKVDIASVVEEAVDRRFPIHTVDGRSVWSKEQMRELGVEMFEQGVMINVNHVSYIIEQKEPIELGMAARAMLEAWYEKMFDSPADKSISVEQLILELQVQMKKNSEIWNDKVNFAEAEIEYLNKKLSVCEQYNSLEERQNLNIDGDLRSLRKQNTSFTSQDVDLILGWNPGFVDSLELGRASNLSGIAESRLSKLYSVTRNELRTAFKITRTNNGR